MGSGTTYITYTNSFCTTPANSSLMQNFGQNQYWSRGSWALNYNFSDAAILSAGGFSASQNIINVSAVPEPSAGVNAFGGLGVMGLFICYRRGNSNFNT